MTGHRGLPRAELFTRLDEIKKGELIYIRVLNDNLAYEVDDVRVIEPDDVSTLQPVSGKDMITLITCTPYGINTHRLVVQGVRVPYVESLKEDINNSGYMKLTESKKSRIYGIIIGIVILVVFIFLYKKRKKNKDGKEN